MVNETIVISSAQLCNGTGRSVPTTDWVTYHFPQLIDLPGTPDKFSGGSGFFFWQRDEIVVNS